MSSAFIGVQGGNLVISLTIGNETLGASVAISSLAGSLGIANIRGAGTKPPIVPELPKLPASLTRRMSPDEINQWAKDQAGYKQSLAVALQEFMTPTIRSA